MRVLVTGATGFIGSALVPALAGRGHEVRSMPRDAASLEEFFRGSEVLIHLANFAHAIADPALLRRVNLEGTRRVAQLAAACGVRRMVYVSSIKASGEETRDRPFDGSETPAPQDAYGRVKLDAERAAQEVAAATGLELVIARPPLVYGPRVRANFLSLMSAIARGWPLPFASISNRRSLIYVGNLVDALERCLVAPAGRTYVLSDGRALSTPELCRSIGAALGTPARLVPFPAAALELVPRFKRLTRSLEVDDHAFRSDLRWQPPFSLDAGLRETASWYGHR
jgi:nucleoside-diphosphate-sugar epimerase